MNILILNLDDYTQIPSHYTGVVQKHPSKSWWVDGKLHRIDGTAYSKEWYFEGKLHRTEGPAWEEADGSKAWWVFDKGILTESSIILVI